MGNNLPTFSGATITITPDKTETYCAGQTITGRVRVQQDKPFKASALIIELIAIEHCYFCIYNGQTTSEYRSDKVLMKATKTLTEMSECVLGANEYSF